MPLEKTYKIICNRCNQVIVVKFKKGEIKKLRFRRELRCPKCGNTSIFLYKI